MVKDTYENGVNTKEELYYKKWSVNGEVLQIMKILKLHYDNGNLIMTYNDKTGESIIYHEKWKSFNDCWRHRISYI